jgi:hypothetical protein
MEVIISNSPRIDGLCMAVLSEIQKSMKYNVNTCIKIAVEAHAGKLIE